MIKIVLFLVLLLVGAAAGGGAGWMLTPPPPLAEGADAAKKTPDEDEEPKGTEFVKMGRQFIVPLMEEERVRALIVIGINLEVVEGSADRVRAQSPKIRNAFLQILLDHAQFGALGSAFTRSADLRALRENMTDAALRIVGDDLHDVLITDVARQDAN